MAKKNDRKNIYVYASWKGLKEPTLMGTLFMSLSRGSEIFSFEYEKSWLTETENLQLDPDLEFYPGEQHLHAKKINFGLFLDSCPDRWGRVLMDRREAVLAKQQSRLEKKLQESDYLLGVFDGHRMGALRFKLDLQGDFLNDDKTYASPPWTKLRELEQASLKLEEQDIENSPEYLKWLNMLISPGSSLGGARPKASVIDELDRLWIAKFPSHNDAVDIGAWEMVVHQIALAAGVTMSECRVQKFNSSNHTFMTRRFDREQQGKRIHFSSAMTNLGKLGGDEGTSYIEIAEFIALRGSHPNEDLEQLWRRIILNICVSNVDDHLRNHGFLLNPEGWRLSPAYDINPVRHGNGLKLNISETDNSQDLELALSVINYFRVDSEKARKIMRQVQKAVANWKKLATALSISKAEQDRMKSAFRI